jgi:hypothetical protein
MKEKQVLIEQIKELLSSCNDLEILYIIQELLVKTSN